MTAAVQDAAAPPTGLCALLLAWINGYTHCRSGAVLIEGRTEGGIGEFTGQLRLDGRSFTALPMLLLEKLEDVPGWAMTTTAAVWPENGASPAWLPMLFVTRDLAPEFTDDEGGWRWRPNAARGRAAAEALEAFPIAASVVIDGYASLAAVWRLEAPIPADADARALLRRLADRLGGQGPEDPLTARLPLPGSIVRGVGTVAPLPVVSFARMRPGRGHALAEFTAALAPAEPTLRRKGVRS